MAHDSNRRWTSFEMSIFGITAKSGWRSIDLDSASRRSCAGSDSVSPQGSRQAPPARPSLDGELLPFRCRYAPLTVEEPAPSRDGTPAWPRIPCRSQIVAPLSAPAAVRACLAAGFSSAGNGRDPHYPAPFWPGENPARSASGQMLRFPPSCDTEVDAASSVSPAA